MTQAEREANGDDATTAVETLPEANRVMLRKTAWDSDAYAFDTVFHSGSSQSRVFTEVALPVVEAVVKGYNGTVMAYGQTGTGKTYTLGERGNDDPAERGIMRRAVEMLMDARDSANTAAVAASGGGINVTVQYLQVYQDNVYDLLAGMEGGEGGGGGGGSDAAEPLNLVEEGGGRGGGGGGGGEGDSEIRVAGARERHVTSTAEVMKLLDEGDSARAVANHKLNATSSRSHAILILRVSNAGGGGGGSGGGGGGKVTKGKLMLVDLAGSERTTKTGTEGHAQKEAQAINKSLSSLGRCIQLLASGGGGHVPYRDSKLTRLLSDSLGGTAMTSLIATVGPLREHYSETASTLKFAQQALKVENTLKVKEGVDYKLLCKQLQVKVDEGLATNERLEKMTREADDKMKAAVARMRDMALAEVELSMAKAGAEREAEKSRVEAEMAKAEAQAAASKAVAEADSGDAHAALQAQFDSERLQWKKEKTDMLQMNTTLWDQLDGVMELLQSLKEQYTEELNYREMLDARDKEVASLRKQLLAQEGVSVDGSSLLQHRSSGSFTGIPRSGGSSFTGVPRSGSFTANICRRVSQVAGGGRMKMMRQPKVKNWCCFSSVEWVDTAVNVDNFPDAFEAKVDGFESTRRSSSFTVSSTSAVTASRYADDSNVNGQGRRLSSARMRWSSVATESDDDTLAELPSQGSNVLPASSRAPRAKVQQKEEEKSSMGVVDAAAEDVHVEWAGGNSGSMARVSSGSISSLVSVLPEDEESEVKKRMKVLTMKLAKEKAAEARKKKQQLAAANNGSVMNGLSNSVQVEFEQFQDSARTIQENMDIDDDAALKAANEIQLFERERLSEILDSLS